VTHRRARRDFFERRDTILVLMASMMSVASQSSSKSVDFSVAASRVSDIRSELIRSAFPYASSKKTQEGGSGGDGDGENAGGGSDDTDYDALFRELDEIIEEKNRAIAEGRLPPSGLPTGRYAREEPASGV